MLGKLKEYKELIGIVVFFIGGFIWMEAQFPKKSDLQNEVASLNCMLEKYMTLTQLQIQGQELQNQIQDFNRQVNLMLPDGRSPTLSPALQAELDELKSDYAHKKSELSAVKESMKKVCADLQRNVCKKR
jgi:seryl-tRNA synthetase